MIDIKMKSKHTEGIYLFKRCPATLAMGKKLIVNERVGYLYCDFDEIEEVINLDEILLKLFDLYGGLTRAQLVEFTRIPRTSLYDALKKLMLQGKVTIEYRHNGIRGRPKTIFKSNLHR